MDYRKTKMSKYFIEKAEKVEVKLDVNLKCGVISAQGRTNN